MSLGEATPATVDLGRIGYDNAWQAVRFVVTLRNRSAVPLVCATPAEPLPSYLWLGRAPWLASSRPALPAPGPHDDGGAVVRAQLLVAPPEAATDPLSSGGGWPTWELAPHGTAEVHGVVFPARLVAAVGAADPLAVNAPWASTLALRNLGNPAQALTVALAAQLTTYELRWTRLADGDCVVLPTLAYPPPRDVASLGDPWFAINNVADRAVPLEVRPLPSLESLALPWPWPVLTLVFVAH
jgi:hypothetical protein